MPQVRKRIYAYYPDLQSGVAPVVSPIPQKKPQTDHALSLPPAPNSASKCISKVVEGARPWVGLRLKCARGMRMKGRYSIELFSEGGEGVEQTLFRADALSTARELYKVAAAQYHGQLIMLCDRARVLARSDWPETKPR